MKYDEILQLSPQILRKSISQLKFLEEFLNFGMMIWTFSIEVFCFRSRNKFWMTVERVEAQLHQFIDIKESFLVKTQNLDVIILSVFRNLKPLTVIFSLGIVSCTIEDLPELSIDTVSIYAEPDANQNSATAVDLVLVYNQDLLKTLGKMSAATYFSSSRQLLLDNPSLLEIWHWELVPGQIVENFSPAQPKGDAYGAFVFANYLTAGDHRVRVAPNGIVKILLLRDDLRSLEMFNTHDMNMGKTMSNISNHQHLAGYEKPCQIKLGPTGTPMASCRRRAPQSPPCTLNRPVVPPCMRPPQKGPIQIITRPLTPPPVLIPKPCNKLR